MIRSQLGGQALHMLFGIEIDPQTTAGFQFYPVDQFCLGAQSINDTGKLSCVAPGFTEFLFEPIELFDHGHWNDQIVVFKTKQRLGIVQKHVGIENKCFFHNWATLPGKRLTVILVNVYPFRGRQQFDKNRKISTGNIPLTFHNDLAARI